MNLSRLLARVSLALVCAAAASAGDARIGNFVKYDAGEYVIVTSRSASQARRFVEDLARFRVTLERTLGKRATPNTTPTTIVITSSTDWKEWLQPRQNVAGFFQRGRFSNYLAMNGDAPPEEARHLVFHEYSHYYLASQFSGEYPPWFNEGLAELMGYAKFDEGRNFANKLWNAVRFALGYVKPAETDHWVLRGLADQWILARLCQTIEATTKALNAFEFKVYADTLYDFIWRDFCDWYIEIIKPTVANDPSQQRVLVTVIDASLRLLHPVMPFITEKLWERLNAVSPQRGSLTAPGVCELSLPHEQGGLLIRAAWPAARLDEEGAAKAEARFEAARQIVAALREVRATYKVPPRQKLACSIKTPAVDFGWRNAIFMLCAPCFGVSSMS